MAQPVSSNPEVAAQYAVQAGLVVRLSEALRKLGLPEWRNASALTDYLTAVAAVTNQFSSASISLSADYYEAMRLQAGVSGAFSIPVNEPWTTDSIEAYLKAATDRLLGQDGADAALDAQVESMASKMTLDAGRYEVIGATEADRKAKGWARIARPGACAFCRLLAARGPVYRSKQTATFRAHTRFDGKGGDCACLAEPQFGAYEPTAQARADASLYSDVAENGMTAAEKRRAFRRAVEADQTSR